MVDLALNAARLRPYVARLALAWPPDVELPCATVVDGTLAYVDISGFTSLTEALSRNGKAGAEELSTLLDSMFAGLLEIAFELDAELVKWGGDAVLLLYTGPQHAVRAVVAARQMQRLITRTGKLRTSVGTARLRMSIGIHTGDFTLFLVGESHRELLLTGPAATMTARLESVAEAGEVLVSPETATALPPSVLGDPKGPGILVRTSPRPPVVPSTPANLPGDPAAALAPVLRDHLSAGDVDSEHRQVAVGFVEFCGVDDLLEAEGQDALAAALHDLVVHLQRACIARGVTFWETDIGENGGKIMLVAGAPTSTDDDAGHLLGVVADVVNGGCRLALRGGVNVGRVFTGDFGPPARRTYSAKGDAVNLAARLMARAEFGHVYASVDALRRSRIPFPAEPLPPFLVKGKAVPISAGRLSSVGTTTVPAAAEGPPFAGRAEELARLEEMLDGARAGHGWCVELVGPPGIGKSRLVDELLIRASGCAVLRTRCADHRAAVPYAPLRDLLRQALGLDDSAPPALAGTTLTDRLRTTAPDLLAWAPLLATVLGAEVHPTREVEGLDDRFRRARLEATFPAFVRALLSPPAVLVLDDADLLDEASASLVRTLADDVHGAPWLVLLTVRQDAPDPLSGVAGRATSMELAPLDDDAVAKLLQSVTEDAPLAPHLRAEMAATSAGNPLFLLELATSGDALREGGLPDTVEQVVAAQIDRLPPDDRRLLRAASVLGARVRVDVLREVLGEPLPPERIQGLSDHLVPDGENTLRFRHELMREAAYEGLPYARRRRLHAAACSALLRLAGSDTDDVAPLLAVHASAARDLPSAWHWSRIAADRAAAVHATVDAAHLYERALDAGRDVAAADPAQLAEVAEALGEARTHLGQFEQAEAAFRLASRWTTAPLDRARLGYAVAQIAERRGDYRRCLQRLSTVERVLTAAGTEVGDGPAARLRAQVRAEYGFVRYRQGRGTDAVRLLREAVALAEGSGAADTLATALLYLDIAELTVGMQGDGQYAKRALATVCAAGGNPWMEARALNQLGVRKYFDGRWDDAVRHYENSRRACERAGDSWTAAVESANIAEVLSDQGHLAEARAPMEQALQTYRAAGTHAFVADGTRLLGRLAARQGELDRAELLLTTARVVFAEDGETLEVIHTDAMLAEAALVAGDHETALARAGTALAEAAGLPGRGLVTPLLHRVLGLAWSGLGDRRAALDALRTSIAEARGRSASYELALSLRALAELSPDPEPEVEAEAAALAARLGLVPGHPAAAGHAA
jgi:class 3 adenylate cyclase/tetratricopeptide (TPR) repeat protein